MATIPENGAVLDHFVRCLALNVFGYEKKKKNAMINRFGMLAQTIIYRYSQCRRDRTSRSP